MKWKCRTAGKLQWDQSSLCLLICTVHNVIQNKQYTGTHNSWIQFPVQPACWLLPLSYMHMVITHVCMHEHTRMLSPQHTQHTWYLSPFPCTPHTHTHTHTHTLIHTLQPNRHAGCSPCILYHLVHQNLSFPGVGEKVDGSIQHVLHYRSHRRAGSRDMKILLLSRPDHQIGYCQAGSEATNRGAGQSNLS